MVFGEVVEGQEYIKAIEGLISSPDKTKNSKPESSTRSMRLVASDKYPLRECGVLTSRLADPTVVIVESGAL